MKLILETPHGCLTLHNPVMYDSQGREICINDLHALRKAMTYAVIVCGDWEDKEDEKTPAIIRVDQIICAHLEDRI